MKRFLKTAGVLVVMCFIGALLYGGTGCGHDDNLSLLEADTGAGANGEVDVGGDCPDCECNCDDDCCEGGDVICDCDATATATCEGECCCCDCCDEPEKEFCDDDVLDEDLGEECIEDEDCVEEYGFGATCMRCMCVECEDDCDSDCDGVGDSCDPCPNIYNETDEDIEADCVVTRLCEQRLDDLVAEPLITICHVGEFCPEPINGPVLAVEEEEEPMMTDMCVPDWCACCREPRPAPVPALAKVLDPVPVEEEECIGFGEPDGLLEPNEPHEYHPGDYKGLCLELQPPPAQKTVQEITFDPIEYLHEYCNPEPFCGDGVVEGDEFCDPPMSKGPPCKEGEWCNADCSGCEQIPR
jgi:hypothetical protein